MEDTILPTALYIGVPYELFWTLNPHKLEPYYKAEKMRIEAKNNRENVTSWLIGISVRDAIASCFSKSHRYPKKPIDLNEKPKSDAEKFAEWAKKHNEEMREVRKARRLKGK